MPLPCDGMGSGLQCSLYLHLMHITVPRCFVTFCHPLATNNVQLPWGRDRIFRSAAAAYHSTGLYIVRCQTLFIFSILQLNNSRNEFRHNLTNFSFNVPHNPII